MPNFSNTDGTWLALAALGALGLAGAARGGSRAADDLSRAGRPGWAHSMDALAAIAGKEHTREKSRLNGLPNQQYQAEAERKTFIIRAQDGGYSDAQIMDAVAIGWELAHADTRQIDQHQEILEEAQEVLGSKGSDLSGADFHLARAKYSIMDDNDRPAFEAGDSLIARGTVAGDDGSRAPVAGGLVQAYSMRQGKLVLISEHDIAWTDRVGR